MRTGNLYKVEIYRFFHSCNLFIGMAAGLFIVLLLASGNSDVLLGDGTLPGGVEAAMKIANLIIVFFASVIISVYVGREFKQKTINYEIMSGRRLWEIGFTKTVTCGIFVSVFLLCGIFLFFMTAPEVLQRYTFLRIALMFLILFHICSCTTLYVLLCGNGALGGCLSFVRFTMLEVLVLFAAKLFLSTDIYDKCRTFAIMSQWSAAVNTDIVIPQGYPAGIVMGTVAEYLLLLAIIRLRSEKTDY
ncbi:MAG: hypothetical protein NC086_09565 [Alistipes sp.]|nr:hypothetical protein [Alistipes sp.]